MRENPYKEIIIDHYRHPHNFGRLVGATGSAKVFNSLCGDLVEIFVATEKGQIKKISFLGNACAICTASASLLTDKVKGVRVDQAIKLNEKDVLRMMGIEISPARMKCALLPLEALKKALNS